MFISFLCHTNSKNVASRQSRSTLWVKRTQIYLHLTLAITDCVANERCLNPYVCVNVCLNTLPNVFRKPARWRLAFCHICRSSQTSPGLILTSTSLPFGFVWAESTCANKLRECKLDRNRNRNRNWNNPRLRLEPKLKLKQELKVLGHCKHIYRHAGGKTCPRRLEINRDEVNELEYFCWADMIQARVRVRVRFQAEACTMPGRRQFHGPEVGRSKGQRNKCSMCLFALSDQHNNNNNETSRLALSQWKILNT